MEVKLFGCKVKQRDDIRTCDFFIFIAPAKEVKKWAKVKSSAEHKEGTQRIFRKARAKAIRKFLSANSINTIPNNILLAFNEGISTFEAIENTKLQTCFENDLDNHCNDKIQWGYLQFTFDETQENEQVDIKPALVVDGQHRLFGIAEYENEDLPLLFVSLIDAPLQEQAFQFIVINDKAVKVNQANAKSIIADIDEDALISRLLESGVSYGKNTPLLKMVDESDESAFCKLLKWDFNREGIQLVDVTGIEQMAQYTREYFGRYLDNDYDSLLEIMFSIWKAVKANFDEFWEFENNIPNSTQRKFFSKVNLLALHEFMNENLKKGYDFEIVKDIYDSDSVVKFSTTLVNKISPNFWTSEWRTTLKDTADVRRTIKNALESTVENYKMGVIWNKDLDLIKSSSENSDEE